MITLQDVQAATVMAHMLDLEIIGLAMALEVSGEVQQQEAC